MGRALWQGAPSDRARRVAAQCQVPHRANSTRLLGGAPIFYCSTHPNFADYTKQPELSEEGFVAGVQPPISRPSASFSGFVYSGGRGAGTQLLRSALPLLSVERVREGSERRFGGVRAAGST